jgi:ABC-type transport system involved in multi-copper enzyme maturation permease subunit
MLTFNDIFIIARQEVASTFRGRKGIALVVTLLLLAAAPALLRYLGQHTAEATALQRAHTAAMVRMYDRDIARLLLDCPAPLVVVAIATFFCQPLFVLMAGSDRLAAEIDSGSIRFWTVRTPRVGIVLGKALGLWMVVSLITAGVEGAITVLALVDDPAEWLSTLGWSARIMLFTSASALVYASLCTLLGAALARPRWVLFLGLAAVLGLRVTRAALLSHGTSGLASLFPGAIDERFLTAGVLAKLTALALVAGWSALLLAGAAAVFKRRSV